MNSNHPPVLMRFVSRKAAPCNRTVYTYACDACGLTMQQDIGNHQEHGVEQFTCDGLSTEVVKGDKPVSSTFITLEVQPIETAPKDREIIVYRGEESAVVEWGRQVDVKYDPNDTTEGWCVDGSFNDEWMNCDLFEDPTHWSPKPVLSAATERPGYAKIPVIKVSE